MLRIFVIDELESDRRMSPLPIAIDIRPTGGTYRPVGPSPESARSSTGSPLWYACLSSSHIHARNGGLSSYSIPVMLFCFLLSYLNTNSPFVSAVGVVQVQHAAAALPITR